MFGRRWFEFRFVPACLGAFVGFLLLLCASCAGPTVGTPAHYDQISDTGWRFIRQDVPNARDPKFDDSSWQVVSLPHTYNALDGQEGGNKYYRGPAWYRTQFTLVNPIDDKDVFVRFEAVSLKASVYVNGQLAGEHRGGFTAFCFDITRLVHRGENLIAVRCDNSLDSDMP